MPKIKNNFELWTLDFGLSGDFELLQLRMFGDES